MPDTVEVDGRYVFVYYMADLPTKQQAQFSRCMGSCTDAVDDDDGDIVDESAVDALLDAADFVTDDDVPVGDIPLGKLVEIVQTALTEIPEG